MSAGDIVHGVASHGPFRSWAATHNGMVRTHNEDAYVNRPDLGLWAVADGAGGHDSGEVASGEVAATLQALPQGLSAGQILAEVRHRLEATHLHLRETASQRGAGSVIATTVVVLVARDDHFACLWAGDSRAYLLRGGTLTRVTRDHSLVQDLVDSGAITEAASEKHPHANVITRAIGASTEILDLEKRTGRLMPGDRFLLCSDGVCKTLADAQLGTLLGADDDAGAERLIMAALAAEANDNVTAVTIEIVRQRP
jgi:serine/threonine-protein phosphatase Stp1